MQTIFSGGEEGFREGCVCVGKKKVGGGRLRGKHFINLKINGAM
jgi:hypothetical protein